jgi:5-methylcytosine-specific restriction endonuclease McrA
MKRKPNCGCCICGKKMYRRPSQIKGGNVYCSLVCTGLGQQKSKTCKICNKQYVGNKKTCSRACANKARTGIKYTKEGRFDKAYRGSLLKEKVAKKRGGACERCGENNYAILQVHHKRERCAGGTDRLSNLELLCPNCHAAHHLGVSLFDRMKSAKVARVEYRYR